MPPPRRASFEAKTTSTKKASRKETFTKLRNLKGSVVRYDGGDGEVLEGVVTRINTGTGRVFVDFNGHDNAWFDMADKRLRVSGPASTPARANNRGRRRSAKAATTPQNIEREAREQMDMLDAAVAELLAVQGTADLSSRRKRRLAMQAKQPAALGLEHVLPPSPRLGLGAPVGGKLVPPHADADAASGEAEAEGDKENYLPKFRVIYPNTLKSVLQDSVQPRGCRPVDVSSLMLSYNTLMSMARSRYAARLPASGQDMSSFQEGILRTLFSCGDEALALAKGTYMRIARAEARAEAREALKRRKSNLSNASSNSLGIDMQSDSDIGQGSDSDVLDSDEDGDEETRQYYFEQRVKEKGLGNRRSGALKGIEDAARAELSAYLQELRTVAPRAWLPTSTATVVEAVEAAVKAAAASLASHERASLRDRAQLGALLRCTVLGLDHLVALIFADACDQARETAGPPSFCVLEGLEQPELLREHLQQIVQAALALHGILADADVCLDNPGLTTDELAALTSNIETLKHVSSTIRRLFVALTLGLATHAYSFASTDDKALLRRVARAVLEPPRPVGLLSIFGVRADADLAQTHADLLEAAQDLVATRVLRQVPKSITSSQAPRQVLSRRAKAKKLREEKGATRVMGDFELERSDHEWVTHSDWVHATQACAVLAFVDPLEDRATSRLLALLADQEVVQEQEVPEPVPVEATPRKKTSRGRKSGSAADGSAGRSSAFKRQAARLEGTDAISPPTAKKQKHKSSQDEKPTKKTTSKALREIAGSNEADVKASAGKKKKKAKPPAVPQRLKLVNLHRTEEVPHEGHFDAENKMKVGRAKHCDLRFTGRLSDNQLLSISRVSAELTLDTRKGVCKMQVNASAGVKVNGGLVSKGETVTLHPGDRVSFAPRSGPRRFEYQVQTEEDEP